MRYKTPNLEGNRIAYKGRRFWVIELTEGRSFQLVAPEFADIVVYDRLNDCPIARVQHQPNGNLLVTANTVFCPSDIATSLKQAAQLADELVNAELRAYW